MGSYPPLVPATAPDVRGIRSHTGGSAGYSCVISRVKCRV